MSGALYGGYVTGGVLDLTNGAAACGSKYACVRFVLNPRGGSGKTTPINLASYFATQQQTPVLMDFDPRGSSLRWVKKRQPHDAAAAD